MMHKKFKLFIGQNKRFIRFLVCPSHTEMQQIRPRVYIEIAYPKEEQDKSSDIEQ